MTRLLLFVDGRLRAVCEDTPEGRVQIDKLAMVAREETSGTVEVRRGGAGKDGGAAERNGHADSPSAAVGAAAAGGDRLPLAGSNPVPSALDAAVARQPAGSSCVAGARLCKIALRPGPSGVALRHSFDCPDKPGGRIDVAEEYPGKHTTMPRLGGRGPRW